MTEPVRSIKILSIVGARPNFIKIASIARAVEEHNISGCTPTINHLVVHTGQHYDNAMSSYFFKDLELPRPHINLGVGSATHAVQTGKIMERFEPVLLKEQPDILLIVGDVNSTIACTLVASKIRYNGTAKRSRPIVGHVEAGLRSFDRTMPEEINRMVTDALSDLLFITEMDAMKNLEHEGIPRNKIHFVGNVMIDTLIEFRDKAKQLRILDHVGLKTVSPEKSYGVVTLHRPSNVDDPVSLNSFVECLGIIAERLPIIFPSHPRTTKNLRHFGLYSRLDQNKNVHLIRPLGYLEFLNLLLDATLVMTDSGGIQEETTFLQIPCITLRENTERPVTISLGTNYLVGTDPKKIVKTVFDILEGRKKEGSIPPQWDGFAARRILDVLLKCMDL